MQHALWRPDMNGRVVRRKDPQPTGQEMDLNQITITVRNLAEGIEFYRALGLRLIAHDAASLYARFELPSGSTTLSLCEDKGSLPGAAVLYFEVDDVDRHYATLLAKGIAFETAPTDETWRWREARFSDPSGNSLCLYHAGADRRFPPWRIKPAAT
jgi:hydroxymethylpyrimidine/phosphomethylpyrimidine kinase